MVGMNNSIPSDGLYRYRAGMHNPWPAGQIRPPKEFYPALGAG